MVSKKWILLEKIWPGWVSMLNFGGGGRLLLLLLLLLWWGFPTAWMVWTWFLSRLNSEGKFHLGLPCHLVYRDYNKAPQRISMKQPGDRNANKVFGALLMWKLKTWQAWTRGCWRFVCSRNNKGLAGGWRIIEWPESWLYIPETNACRIAPENRPSKLVFQLSIFKCIYSWMKQVLFSFCVNF